jgi:AcrR family transcriptional regulator
VESLLHPTRVGLPSPDKDADERVAGFIRAVVAVMGEPDIAAALAADVDAVRDCFTPWVEMAQQRGEIRDDLTPVRATRWPMVLLDGFLDRIISEPDFTVATEKDSLLDAADRLLAP